MPARGGPVIDIRLSAAVQIFEGEWEVCNDEFGDPFDKDEDDDGPYETGIW